MRFVDTHCHLKSEGFEAMLDRGREAGVAAFVVCGTEPNDWDRLLQAASRHRDLVPMLGLHPWYVARAGTYWLERLEKALLASGAGVGECGLDFLEEDDHAAQEEALRAQLRLAKALDRPLSLHCRRAWERLAQLVREEGLPQAGAVLHAFSGSAETAKEMQSLGFHLGFGGALLNPANHRAAKAVVAVAEDRWLVESDAHDTGGLEPAELFRVVERAAKLRGDDPTRLAQAAHRNACALFGKGRP